MVLLAVASITVASQQARAQQHEALHVQRQPVPARDEIHGSGGRRLSEDPPRRLDQLADWLVDLNLGLKGGSPLAPTGSVISLEDEASWES